MPGDTKIQKTTLGWIDVDIPTSYYRARRQARDARRLRVAGYIPTASIVASQRKTGLSSLQQRLYDRLTTQQGVTVSDAYDVVTSYGYNAAASYGHMREAGATHEDALTVIDLGLPSVSVEYGQHRAAGYDHADALGFALDSGVLDDDDD